MVNLFVSVYNEPHEDRKKELDYCLNKNIENASIDRIYILLEPDTEYSNSEKETIIQLSERPTFKSYFKAVNSVSTSQDINIIINSDIYFEASDINKIKARLNNKKCFALTRYDLHDDLTATFLDRRDSQDSWCFQGKVRYAQIECDFYLGKPGCDNRIAHELKKVRYEITNPSRSIKSYHLHNTQVKSYERTEEHIVKPPYLRLDPIS